MKKVMYIVPAFTLVASFNIFAGTLGNKALNYVPGAKVVQEKNDEVKLETKAGTIVEVEFKRDGSFEEASGDNVEKDEFKPESGLSLAGAIDALKKENKTPKGSWSYEKSMLKDWHYELEGFENGKEMEYLVDAKTGKLLESKADD